VTGYYEIPRYVLAQVKQNQEMDHSCANLQLLPAFWP
jgi:hypothetical protein